jgi:hypothetical protein
MGEAAKDFKAHGDDLVACGPTKVGDEAEAARVAFERGIVESARGRQRHGADEYAVV